MWFVVFEFTAPKSKEAISTQYYVTLQALLQQQPGFISEVPFVSLQKEDRQVLVAQFVDEAAIHQWRLHPVHLKIEKNARETIFEWYRLRVGEELSPENEEAKAPEGKTGRVMLLHQYPTPEGKTEEISRDILALVDKDKHSIPDISETLIDSALYQGEHHVLWISAWRDKEAATMFGNSIRHRDGDRTNIMVVARDYGKVDRREAPEDADEAQRQAVLDHDGNH